VVDKVSLRAVFHILASHSMRVVKFDVSTAFLNAGLNEEIFVALPTDVFEFPRGSVFKLRKALYGLKQSPRAWHAELASTLATIGFVPNPKDPCVFMKFENNSLVAILAVHVDDGLLWTVSSEYSNEVCRLLMLRYRISVSSDPDVYLGIDIEWF
jgi:hypothetical protein